MAQTRREKTFDGAGGLKIFLPRRSACRLDGRTGMKFKSFLLVRVES